jgi:hypothetical protein
VKAADKGPHRIERLEDSPRAVGSDLSKAKHEAANARLEEIELQAQGKRQRQMAEIKEMMDRDGIP